MRGEGESASDTSEKKEKDVAHARTADDTAILSVARSRADCEAVAAWKFHLRPRSPPSVPLSTCAASPTDFRVPRTLSPLRRRCLTRASWPHHQLRYPLRHRRPVPSLRHRVSLTESNRREVRARTPSRVGARTNIEPRLSPYLVHATDQFTLFLLAR